MKFRLFRFLVLPGLALLAAPWAFLRAAAQFPPQIKNIVVIFQENRTPDNLFHFLTPACPLRGDRSGSWRGGGSQRLVAASPGSGVPCGPGHFSSHLMS